MFSQDHFHPILSIRQIGLLPSYIHGHRSETEFLRFSPDGRLLASTAEWDTIVLIWDVKSETLLRKLTFTTKINDLAFSPDGMQIAIATADIITLWDRTANQTLGHISVDTNKCMFSQSGKELILVDSQGTVSFWDLARQQTISSFQAIPEGYSSAWCAVSTQLSCLALTTNAHEAFLWLFDSAEGAAVPLTTIAVGNDDGIVFSPDGKLLASIVMPPKQRKPHIQIYDIQEQVYKLDLVSPTPFIGIERSQPLAFSPESTYLVVAGMSGELFFWDVCKQRFITTVPAHPNPGNLPYYGISALAWSPANHCLATGGWEQKDPSFNGESFCIKLWKIDQT